MRTRAEVVAGLGALVLLSAVPASAHGALPGGGGFYAGLAHPFLAIPHLLLLLALGLLLGRRPMPVPRLPLIALAAGLAAGLALGRDEFLPLLLPSAIVGLGLVMALWLAAAFDAPVGLLTALALATGLGVGLDTGVPPQAAGWLAAAAPYMGVAAAVALVVLDAAALSTAVNRPPLAISLRVAGSWLAAMLLIILAFQARGLGV